MAASTAAHTFPREHRMPMPLPREASARPNHATTRTNADSVTLPGAADPQTVDENVFEDPREWIAETAS